MKWIFLLFLFGACSKTPEPTQTLRISFNTHPNTIDPTRAGDFVSSTLICLIYEGLTRSLPGGAVEPALAERVEISPDEKTYTFYLRKADWSDGTPITAHDFERSWKKALSSSSLCAYLFYPIQNSEECAKGELPLEALGIYAIDSLTFRVELKEPTPYFYSLVAFPSFLPSPSKIGDVFSGPFCIEKGGNHSEIILVKNPTFWNEKETLLDRIHISIIPDETTTLQMFERGDLDWIGASLSPLPLDALDRFKEKLTFIPCAATTLCTFNTELFPFNNLHLRKAFSYSIDRNEIIDKVTQVGQIPASSMLPPHFSDQDQILFDPLLAKSHLEKSGIALSELQSLILYYKSGQGEKRLAQTLQRQWEKTLGITVQLVQLDFKSHAQRLHSRDYQLSLATWIAQFDHPISILDRFKDRNNLKNYPGWEDPQYSLFLSEKQFSLAEERLADQMPLTPIYHWNFPSLAGPRIEELPSIPCGGILFERLSLN